jgi:hypothetical protein
MDLKKFADWPSAKIRRGDGIVVGADITQEWLLAWWWEHYRKHNSHKVAFIDLGLSFEMKEWCRERGELIPLRISDDFVEEKSKLDAGLVHAWEQAYGKVFWDSRIAWFKKPFACLQTPFLRTVWIDIDCEIRGSIQGLFAYADQAAGIAMAREQCEVYVDYPLFNSGVITFRSNLDLISDWATACLQGTSHYLADDRLFSHMIEKRKISISEIPPFYNWSRCQQDQGKAIILHWHGTRGKEVLRERIHLSALPDFGDF